MRGMLERISPVLFATVAAGGLVVSSALPATAQGDNATSNEARDRLDPERRNAAPAYHVMSGFNWHDPAGLEPFFDPPPPPPEPEPEPEPVVVQHWAPVPSGGAPAQPSAAPVNHGGCDGDVACFLECTRAHESDTSGGYGAVSPGGTYRGAYQFVQPTWDAAVEGAGHGDWAGVPAEQAPAEVQDAAAAHLYSVSGNRPWGGRC